ncbi:MAG TPA: hypothetical protein VK536_01505 [Candidatus Limnocylindrales bacterium]|nr:hypothetical protein [Candidatus Limnocylindrales bacterium]
MPLSKIIVLVVLASMLFFGSLANCVLVGPSSGYVQYKISFTSSKNSSLLINAIVNETVRPTGQAGFIDLTLGVFSNFANFTYSRDVNATSLPEIFPYLTGLTNQSFSYQIRGYALTASLVDAGQTTVTFNGTNYQATKYLVSFSATNSSSENSISGSGDIICLPSDLIDTAQLSLNQTATVNVTLLSTNLSLSGAASGINPVGASLLGILLAAAVAIAAPTIFRNAKKNKQKDQAEESDGDKDQKSSSDQEKGDEKPSYWVD